MKMKAKQHNLTALCALVLFVLTGASSPPSPPPSPAAAAASTTAEGEPHSTDSTQETNSYTSPVVVTTLTSDTNSTKTSDASITLTSPPTCPEGCDCVDGLQEEYSCANGTLDLILQPKEYLHIICHDSLTLPESPPTLEPQPMPSVSVSGCGAPAAAGGWARYLQALGARGVTSLTVRAPPPAAAPLSPGHLAGLRGLTALSLDGTAPARLPPGLLAELPELRRLKLRGALTELPADAFAEAPRLEQLEVAMTNVSVLEPGAFRGLRALRRLGMWAAGLHALPADALSGLEALQVLELRGNELSSLPAGLFVGLRSLQKLSLADNRLTSVPAPLPLVEGRLLDLSRNRIDALRPGDFASLTRLRSLNLDGNRIQKLADGVFAGLTSLEELFLRSNGLVEVSPRAFSDTPALRRLLLDDNRLALEESAPAAPALASDPAPDIGPGPGPGAGPAADHEHAPLYYSDFGTPSPFQSLTELRELSLRRNRVSRVAPDWRLVLLRLQRLDLAHNRLRALTDADLNFLSSNIEIDMRYNNISTVELSPPLPAETLEGGSPDQSGARVLLEHNPLLCDCRLAELARRAAAAGALLQAAAARCAAPAALAGRALSAVPLEALACALGAGECPASCRCTLRPAADALELECSRAPTAWPAPDRYGVTGSTLQLLAAPRSLPALPAHTHTLVLRALNLTRLEGAPPPSLARLDLRDNLLRAAPRALLRRDLSLRLQLAGNPLLCDCEHAEDLLLLQRNSDRVEQWSELRCAVRGGAEGAALVMGGVSAEALCAARRLALQAAGALAALAALLALAAALCWRWRLLLRACWAARAPACCRRAAAAGGERPQYDAFVSYSHADEEWVLGTLVARLERAGRRLCVHCRDWVPGELIPAQIARSVHSSRSTLVVLSPAYLRSAWAQEEWRAARGGRLLVVLLGAVRREELSPELRAHLAANTYVKVGDPWLWDKLLYAVPALAAAPPAPAAAPATARLAALRKGFDDRIEGLSPPPPPPAGALNALLTPDGHLVNDTDIKERM